jgi:hypothetical protein
MMISGTVFPGFSGTHCPIADIPATGNHLSGFRLLLDKRRFFRAGFPPQDPGPGLSHPPGGNRKPDRIFISPSEILDPEIRITDSSSF